MEPDKDAGRIEVKKDDLMTEEEFEAFGALPLSFGRYRGKLASEAAKDAAYCSSLRQYEPCSLNQAQFFRYLDTLVAKILKEGLGKAPPKWNWITLKKYRANPYFWSADPAIDKTPTLYKDVLVLVFKYLTGFYDVFYASQVCKSWRVAALQMPKNIRSVDNWALTPVKFGQKHLNEAFGSVVAGDPDWCQWLKGQYDDSKKREHIEFLNFYAYIQSKPKNLLNGLANKYRWLTYTDFSQFSHAYHFGIIEFDDYGMYEQDYDYGMLEEDEEEEEQVEFDDYEYFGDDFESDQDANTHGDNSASTPIKKGEKRPRSQDEKNETPAIMPMH